MHEFLAVMNGNLATTFEDKEEADWPGFQVAERSRDLGKTHWDFKSPVDILPQNPTTGIAGSFITKIHCVRNKCSQPESSIADLVTKPPGINSVNPLIHVDPYLISGLKQLIFPFLFFCLFVLCDLLLGILVVSEYFFILFVTEIFLLFSNFRGGT